MPFFLDEQFLRLVVPMTDWTIWEGMINTTLLNLIRLDCMVWGMAGMLIMVRAWDSYRINHRGRKNEI